MTEHTIPLITVRGSYAEVGAAIGDACGATIERECDTARLGDPPGPIGEATSSRSPIATPR